MAQLAIKINDFPDEYEDLLASITCKDDKYMVDADLLVEALLYFKRGDRKGTLQKPTD